MYYYAKSNFRNVFHKTFNLTRIQSTNNVWDLKRQVRKEKAIKNKQWKHNYYNQVPVHATDDSNLYFKKKGIKTRSIIYVRLNQDKVKPSKQNENFVMINWSQHELQEYKVLQLKWQQNNKCLRQQSPVRATVTAIGTPITRHGNTPVACHLTPNQKEAHTVYQQDTENFNENYFIRFYQIHPYKSFTIIWITAVTHVAKYVF